MANKMHARKFAKPRLDVTPASPAVAHRSARAEDVAKLAGVSVATVSRTFSKPQMVRGELREKVTAAAHEIGYAPNSAARALRLRRTHLVGVLVPTLDHAIFARMINAIENLVADAGYFVLVATTGFNRNNIPRKARQLLERGAEAILCVGHVDDSQLRDLLDDRKVPLVATYVYRTEGLFPSIGFDNAQAARSVSTLLRESGHRRMAVLLGPLEGNDRQEARIEGFRAGFEVDGEHIIISMVECVYTFESAIKAFDRIRLEHPDVTAIACSSDVLAAGVLMRCESLGIAIPDQLSVVGFDDLEFLDALRVRLTTVHVPALEMGQAAARAVLARLEHGTDVAPVRLETQLVVRESVAKPFAGIGERSRRSPKRALK